MSIKDGVNYAHAPASALEQVLALRVHLDDSTADNGPLRVLAGTQNLGVLSDEQLHDLSTKVDVVDCLAPCGGVLAMRPLIVRVFKITITPVKACPAYRICSCRCDRRWASTGNQLKDANAAMGVALV